MITLGFFPIINKELPKGMVTPFRIKKFSIRLINKQILLRNGWISLRSDTILDEKENDSINFFIRIIGNKNANLYVDKVGCNPIFSWIGINKDFLYLFFPPTRVVCFLFKQLNAGRFNISNPLIFNDS